ncbi:hypothetical protein HPP92_000496 [Vanilla planifolia]|uniref:Glutaredoxin domain-containing protein n=1 Tax=Vanilla planifolia TaxID=51239 RepID=A0A835VG55_VANPL|nr:hypothetical protein HPP92_000496 [Vanilla planifolia]
MLLGCPPQNAVSECGGNAADVTTVVNPTLISNSLPSPFSSLPLPFPSLPFSLLLSSFFLSLAMQRAVSDSVDKTWAPTNPIATPPTSEGDGGKIARTVTENPVVVVGRRGCCMLHVVRRLLQGQGVNPTVCELGDEADEEAINGQLAGEKLPAVFIGGKLVGGLERLMAVHISGELVPILKDAGALWL